jgi:uncharacterized damage-inducible protein DinB
VVRGEFPDRQFDVDLWLEQGHEAIFDARPGDLDRRRKASCRDGKTLRASAKILYMSVSADVLRTHLDYTAWAGRRLVQAAGTLTEEELNRDFGTADRSVLGTLAHLYGSDRLWLSRLSGSPHPGFVTDADRRLSTLQNDWPVLDARWRDWAARLTAASADSLVSYTDLKGRHWTQPLWQLVLHVVNHGTHHRGQVSGFLRSMGHTPPVCDLVHYYREVITSLPTPSA